MAAIAPFLADIGASDLSPQDRSGTYKIRGLQERIEAEVRQTERAIQQLVEGHREDFEAQEQRTESLESQIGRTQFTTSEAKSALEQEKRKFRAVLKEHATSHDQARRAQALDESTSSLLETHTALQDAAQALDQDDIDGASQRLPHGPTKRQKQTSWYTESSYWTSLMHWQEDLQTQISSRLQEAAQAAVRVDSLERSLRLSPDASGLEGLWEKLTRFDLLNAHLQQLASTVEKSLLQPYFQSWPELAFTSPDAASIVLEPQQHNGNTSLQTFDAFLSFLQNQLPQVFILLAPQVEKALAGHLDATLPSSAEGLPAFKVRLQEAQDLERTHFASSELQSWSQDLSSRWVAKVNMNVASACRDLVLQPGARGWESIQVELPPLETFAPVASSSNATMDHPFPKQQAAEDSTAAPSSSPSTLAPPSAAPKAHKPGHRKNFSTVSIAADDDEWGFGDDASDDGRPAEEPPDDPKVEETGGEDDGWGFDEEEGDDDLDDEKPLDASAAKPATKLMKGKKLGPPSTEPSPRPADDSGWGFDEDDAPTSPSVAQQPSVPPSQPHREQTHFNSASAPAQEPVKFLVSAHSQELVKMAKTVLALMQDIQSTDFALHEDYADIQPRLLQTLLDLFDYFRATMPAAQKQILTSVPALGMQFANDCDWLAGQLVALSKGTEAFRSSEVAAHATCESLRLFAIAERQRQLDLQWAVLDESLAETQSLQDVADPTVFAACERAMRQIKHTLDRLAHVWRPVMDQKAFFANMGDLVNRVIGRLVNQVLAQLDIGEEESQNLSTLCRSLQGLQEIFMDGDRCLVGPFVPLWFKLLFLSEILEGSMVDIMYLFDEGTLVDFSKDEMIKLIRALFSDSATRQKNIDKIRTAPENVQ